MRTLDTNGIRLVEYQANLFAQSVDRFECSSAIFIRRFIHSNLLRTLDKNQSALISLNVEDGFESIENQFGKSQYGKIKYSKEALFWMGYMYRYISYTREINTPLLMKLFKYTKMLDLYYVYHTQDPEWCVKNILEIHNLTEDIFNPNYRLKQAMLKNKEAYLASLNLLDSED